VLACGSSCFCCYCYGRIGHLNSSQIDRKMQCCVTRFFWRPSLFLPSSGDGIHSARHWLYSGRRGLFRRKLAKVELMHRDADGWREHHEPLLRHSCCSNCCSNIIILAKHQDDYYSHSFPSSQVQSGERICSDDGYTNYLWHRQLVSITRRCV